MKEAQKILEKYNKEPFHIHHAKTVAGVMGYFAKQYDSKNEEFWAVCGLLHDIDFELYPEAHCVKGVELLKENNVHNSIIHATMSHGMKFVKLSINQNTLWKRFCLLLTNLPDLFGPMPRCVRIKTLLVSKFLR
jgi:putative nucleotidyltransferase with HDIG domain